MADLQSIETKVDQAIDKRAASGLDGYQIGDRAVRYTDLEKLIDAKLRLMALRNLSSSPAYSVAEVIT